MKIVFSFLFVVFTFSTAAFACPDLAGNHIVTLQNGHKEPVTILQKVVNGTTIYDTGLFGGVLIADGKVHETVDGSILRIKTTKCIGDSVVVNQILKLFNEDGSYKCLIANDWSLSINEKMELIYSPDIKKDTCQD